MLRRRSLLEARNRSLFLSALLLRRLSLLGACPLNRSPGGLLLRPYALAWCRPALSGLLLWPLSRCVPRHGLLSGPGALSFLRPAPRLSALLLLSLLSPLPLLLSLLLPDVLLAPGLAAGGTLCWASRAAGNCWRCCCCCSSCCFSSTPSAPWMTACGTTRGALVMGDTAADGRLAGTGLLTGTGTAAGDVANTPAGGAAAGDAAGTAAGGAAGTAAAVAAAVTSAAARASSAAAAASSSAAPAGGLLLCGPLRGDVSSCFGLAAGNPSSSCRGANRDGLTDMLDLTARVMGLVPGLAPPPAAAAAPLPPRAAAAAAATSAAVDPLLSTLAAEPISELVRGISPLSSVPTLRRLPCTPRGPPAPALPGPLLPAGLCCASACRLVTAAKGEAAVGSAMWGRGDPEAAGSEQPDNEAEVAATAAAAAAAIASGGSAVLKLPVCAALGVVAGKPMYSAGCCCGTRLGSDVSRLRRPSAKPALCAATWVAAAVAAATIA